MRAKAGDKVNMVPRNLVMVYTPDDEWGQCYVGTSPDELISQPLYSGLDTYSCLWFIYQVDAPDSTLRAIPVDWRAYDLADNPGRGFYGWTKDPEVAGRERYYVNGMKVTEWLGFSPSITVELYRSGKLTVKDN